MSRYAKEFKEHAETIARWDQLIVDNSTKIDKLYVRTRTAERQTVSVDMQLTAVENSQSELESWLSKYENDVDEMLAKDSTTPSELGGPDQERERTYKLAEKLGERLDEMERDLGSMVEEVNAANASLSRNGKGDEPVSRHPYYLRPQAFEANVNHLDYANRQDSQFSPDSAPGYRPGDSGVAGKSCHGAENGESVGLSQWLLVECKWRCGCTGLLSELQKILVLVLASCTQNNGQWDCPPCSDCID